MCPHQFDEPLDVCLHRSGTSAKSRSPWSGSVIWELGWGPLAPGELSEELSEDLQIDIQLENRTPKCKAKNGNICLTPVEKVLVVSELKLGVLPAVNDQLALIQ